MGKQYVNKESQRMTNINLRTDNDKVDLSCKIKTWNCFKRVELWARKNGTDKFELVGFALAYYEKYDFKLNQSLKYGIIVKLIGENETVIESNNLNI